LLSVSFEKGNCAANYLPQSTNKDGIRPLDVVHPSNLTSGQERN